MHSLLLVPALLLGMAWGIASVPSIGTALIVILMVEIGRALFGTRDGN